MKTLKSLAISLYAVCCIVMLAIQPLGASPLRYKDYLPAPTCENCHSAILDQYSESQHAKAFSDPLFQAQYFKEILPQAEKDPRFVHEAKACIACHSPIDSIKRK